MLNFSHQSAGTTPSALAAPTGLAGWAEDAALQLLSGLGARLAHTLGVGRQARRISRALRLPGSDADLLEAGGLLHDVGYAHALQRTGFHPIDGANYVFAMTGNRALAGLVAHHSHAWVEARLRGLMREMSLFEEPEPMLADALTYCDMTVGPQGQPMSSGRRLADVHDRYGASHVVARAVTEARPLLLAAVDRTESRIRTAVADCQRKTA